MHPTTNPGPSRAALSTSTARPGTCASLVPCLYKGKSAGGRKRLCLALQPWVIGGVLRQDIVENCDEARVALEGVGRRWNGGSHANREGGIWGRGVEVREQVAVGSLRVREDFLRRVRRVNASIWN